MKLSQLWLRWLRSIMVLVLTLGFYAWSPLPVSAAAEYDLKIPFTDDFDACTGERVTIDGIQHVAERITQDTRGKFHYIFTRNIRGTGVGQVSGDQYILRDTFTRTDIEFVAGQPRLLREEYHSVLIRKGEPSSNDDTIIHFLSKLTINENGAVTTEIAIQGVECR